MKRLLDETNDGLERQLLEEARAYKASPKARAAALAIVGTGKPWAKGIGLKLSLGVLAVGAVVGALWMQRPAKDPAPEPATRTEETPPSTITAQATLQATATPPNERASDPPVETAIATIKPLVTPQSTAKSTLSEEIAVIDRARAAVYSKDREGAIRALDEYERRFPKGSFAPEAKTLRVRAGAL